MWHRIASLDHVEDEDEELRRVEDENRRLLLENSRPPELSPDLSVAERRRQEMARTLVMVKEAQAKALREAQAKARKAGDTAAIGSPVVPDDTSPARVSGLKRSTLAKVSAASASSTLAAKPVKRVNISHVPSPGTMCDLSIVRATTVRRVMFVVV
jgi:hypothetical protein